MTAASTPEQHAAYRAGLCVDCRAVRHSAGRPRCNTCHAAWAALAYPPPPPRLSWTDWLLDTTAGGDQRTATPAKCPACTQPAVWWCSPVKRPAPPPKQC